MSRIEDLQKKIYDVELEIEQKQQELRGYQKEFALLLAEQAGKETLTKFEKELNKRLARIDALNKQMADGKLSFTELSKLVTEKNNEETACSQLEEIIAECKNNLMVNKGYQQKQLFKAMTGEELDEEQPQPE